ncbi:MAG TPA: hypothetical protein VLI04_19420, partial [Nocardioidaceae bacterium]|nr:hypothetical protein [Nocardioidaceae bacterium]
SDVLIDYKRPDASSEDATTFDYTASSVVPSVEIHGTNLTGSSKVKEFHLALRDVPTRISLMKQETSDVSSTSEVLPQPEACNKGGESGKDRPMCFDPDIEDDVWIRQYKTTTTTDTTAVIQLDTPGPGLLGFGEFLLTNGPDIRLPDHFGLKPQDGLLIREVGSDAVINARVTNFDYTSYRKDTNRVNVNAREGDDCCNRGGEELRVQFAATAQDRHLALMIEKQAGAAVKHTVARVAETVGIDLHTRSRTQNRPGTAGNLDGESKTVESRLTSLAGNRVEGYSTGLEQPYVQAFTFDEWFDGDGSYRVTKRAFMDPMPTQFDVCITSDDCAVGVFNESLNKLHAGVTPGSSGLELPTASFLGLALPEGWRFHSCFASCPPDFPSQVSDFSDTSVRIDTSEPIAITYFDGLMVDGVVQGSVTSLGLIGLRRLIIEGDQASYDCDLGLASCKYGYFAIDTGGLPLQGSIFTGDATIEEDYTRFIFPAGFSAAGVVLAFEKTGAARGHVGEVGVLNCPDGTYITIKGQPLDKRFCDGDILEDTVLEGW